jgi:hypothetical protein
VFCRNAKPETVTTGNLVTLPGSLSHTMALSCTTVHHLRITDLLTLLPRLGTIISVRVVGAWDISKRQRTADSNTKTFFNFNKQSRAEVYCRQPASTVTLGIEHRWDPWPYICSVSILLFFFFFFRCSSFDKKGGVGLFYNWCSLTTPYSTRGHIAVLRRINSIRSLNTTRTA